MSARKVGAPVVTQCGVLPDSPEQRQGQPVANSDAMDTLVQEALDDPRPGDTFHEMYSYDAQVLAVTDQTVEWREFNSREIGRGVVSRAGWSRSFRYGDHMPGKHFLRLLERGAG